MTAKIITYGGIIQELWAPDRRGRSANITLGYTDLGGYTLPRGDPPTANPSYFGAIIGRYGNRIGGAKFTLDGQNYTLDANNGPNSLHGGVKGFDKFVWDAESFKDKGVVGLKLTRTSAAGEGCVNPPTACTGYPGNLKVKVDLHARQGTTTCGSTTRRRPTRRRSSTSPTTRTGTCRARAPGRSTTTG